jgi:hypothetical protein
MCGVSFDRVPRHFSQSVSAKAKKILAEIADGGRSASCPGRLCRHRMPAGNCRLPFIAPYVNGDAHHQERRSMPGNSIWKRYGYAWVTAGFFVISLAGHWLFGWFAFANEQQEHHQPVRASEYVVQMTRDTLENWQSEFLQLLWQVGGLALLLYVGSPQSKEGDDRMEAKLDEILRRIDPANGEQAIRRIDEDYAGRHTDPQYISRTS